VAMTMPTYLLRPIIQMLEHRHNLGEWQNKEGIIEGGRRYPLHHSKYVHFGVGICRVDGEDGIALSWS